MRGKNGLTGLLLVCFALAALPAFGASAGPELTTKGYSIFDETIVDMTWPQIEQAAKDGAVIIQPTAVIEEHGPHMGIGVDTYLAYVKCKLIRRELESKGIKAIISPPFFWGINNATGSFPGSFTVRKETMEAVLYDTFANYRRWGFDKLFVINHHGDADHNRTIVSAIEKARVDSGIRAFFVVDRMYADRYGLSGKEFHYIIDGFTPPRGEGGPPKYLEIHAGGGETGMMVAYFPDQVNQEMAKGLKPDGGGVPELNVWRRGWSDGRKATPTGYFGEPAKFDAGMGRKSIEGYAKRTADLIAAFLDGKYTPPALGEKGH
jgi:creatinine amidohydrolase